MSKRFWKSSERRFRISASIRGISLRSHQSLRCKSKKREGLSVEIMGSLQKKGGGVISGDSGVAAKKKVISGDQWGEWGEPCARENGVCVRPAKTTILVLNVKNRVRPMWVR